MAVLFQFLRLLKPKYLIGGLMTVIVVYFIYIAIDRSTLKHTLKNFKATEAQNNERNETNETIRKANDARKCELIGGELSDTGECI